MKTIRKLTKEQARANYLRHRETFLIYSILNYLYKAGDEYEQVGLRPSTVPASPTEKARKWYYAHRHDKEFKERLSAYYKNNIEKFREKNKKWYASHRETSSAYWKANKEWINAKRKEKYRMKRIALENNEK